MPETTPAIKKEETVATPEVKKETVDASTQQGDLAAELADVRAKLAKKTEDAENYKRGMLKAKGKIPADAFGVANEDGEEMEEKIRRIAREESANSEVAQLQAEERRLLDKVLKRNSELETALRNRSQIKSVSGLGSNQEKGEVTTDDYFSPEQLADLKRRGYDDKKIELLKQNMKKVQNMPPPITR